MPRYLGEGYSVWLCSYMGVASVKGLFSSGIFEDNMHCSCVRYNYPTIESKGLYSVYQSATSSLTATLLRLDVTSC